MKVKKDQTVSSSFGTLVNALYESLPRKIRNTLAGTTLVYLALADLRARGVLTAETLQHGVSTQGHCSPTMKLNFKPFLGILVLCTAFFVASCGNDDSINLPQSESAKQTQALKEEENSRITLAVRQELDKDEML